MLTQHTFNVVIFNWNENFIIFCGTISIVCLSNPD
jgi:hypothetical protein